MIRTVLIGVTGYGEFYLTQLLRLAGEGKVEFLGSVVRNPEEAQSQIEELNGVGARVFQTTAEMYNALDGKIDLCCIPTELHSHAKLAIEALEHGCNVQVEKPAAVTVQDITAMRIAAEKAHKKVLVGFQNIYDIEVQSLKKGLLNGDIGELKTIKMKGMWSRGMEYYSRNDWAGKMKIGEDWILDSPANNAFAHYINLLCFLGGTTFESSAKLSRIRAELYRAMPIECCDTAFVKAQTESGISLQFSVTHACSENVDPQITIVGSDGELSWSLPSIDHSRKNMFDKIIEHLNGSDDLVCNLDIAYSLSHLINAMHSAGPITPVTDYSITKTESGEQFVINDIERVIGEAYEKELLPGEFDVAWAKKSEELDSSDLTEFTGSL